MLTLKKARAIAYEAHGKSGTPKGTMQVDKTGRPYTEHLEAVRDGVVVLGGDIQVQAAAILHDVVEDTDVTYADLRKAGANDRQIRAISAVTKTPGAVQKEYLDGIVAAGRDAMMIKLADLLHNMRPDRLASLPDYTQSRLKKKYAPSIARLMKELGYLLTEEQLAQVPQGSYSYTSPYNGSNTNSYEWGMRTTTWVAKGDEVRVSGQPVKVISKETFYTSETSGNVTKQQKWWTFGLEDGTSVTLKDSARLEARMIVKTSTVGTPPSSTSGGGGGPKPSTVTSPCATIPFAGEDYEGWGYL